jgi:apolipoprotein N-acyltransferase
LKPTITSPLAWSAVAGALLALAFPPFNLGFLAYPALAMALWTIGLAEPRTSISVRTVAWRSWLFGMAIHLATLYWAGWVSIPGMIVMVAILGAYVAAVFVTCAALMRRYGAVAVWSLPVLWVGHEYLRGLGALAFPWTNLSLSQVAYKPLIQFADLTGDLGVSALVVVTGVLLFEATRFHFAVRRGRMAVCLAAILLLHLGVISYGVQALNSVKDIDSVRIAVLQGDIDSYAKWEDSWVDLSMATYETQTRDAGANGAELIVWPETAAPMYLRSEVQAHLLLKQLSKELSTSLLVGTLEFRHLDEGGYLRYNAALSIDHGRYSSDFHAKMHLVPFGEWIPFSDHFSVLGKLEVGGAHFTAGDHYVLFEHPKGPYATAICYESAFPDIVRHFVEHGARFLVCITNDGWYGFSSGPPQHAAIAILRAVETRRPIARAANSGISCFIDRRGIVHDASDQYVPDIRIFDLPLGSADEQTYFVRHGMWLGRGCAAASVMLIAWLFALLILRRVAPPPRQG